MILYVRFD